MAKFKHLTKNKVEHVSNQLWKIGSSLNGLGAVFQLKQERGDSSIDVDELYGIGQLLKGLSKQLSVVEDILRRGHDSMALTEEFFENYDKYAD